MMDMRGFPLIVFLMLAGQAYAGHGGPSGTYADSAYFSDLAICDADRAVGDARVAAITPSAVSATLVSAEQHLVLRAWSWCVGQSRKRAMARHGLF